MKTSNFLAVIFSLAFLCSCAKNDDGQLNPIAENIFRNLKSKLSVAQKNQIADSLYFVLVADTLAPFALAGDSSALAYPFSAQAYPIDLNKDGIEELFVSYGNLYTSGNTGVEICVFIKNDQGIYQRNLGVSGMLPNVLKTVGNGYPDLLIGVPGMVYPIYKWNGNKYELGGQLLDRDYQQTPMYEIDSLSSSYQKNIKM